ncbi:MAG: peptide chain release factor 3 [Planctomyces sp.]|nr:peptide chain release factor 3 [Planctomyces sp.]
MSSSPPASLAAPAADGAAADRAVQREVQRRRTFAIISHPDAGKTTLTEKLLLYSGSIAEAGAVRGRKTQRAVTSDWMAMERERGISITSTVLTFEYGGLQINLLDTPGHNDFSEDTYRTLTAADCAVMVIDAAKGIEAQTKKLFKICSARRIPILTFVNKMDRPGCDPLNTLSEISQVLGIEAVPWNWPIGTGRDFKGVYDRQTKQALVFQAVSHGIDRSPVDIVDLNDPPERILSPELAAQVRDEVELIDHAGGAFDKQRFLAGEITPVFFGSALTNFGVEPFFDGFLKLAPTPRPRLSNLGAIPPDRTEFAGVIFKIQANLDPRHHDRVAYLRVCAGRFTRDMEIVHTRTGERIRIKRSQRLFAKERETMDVAYAGDVVGLVIPGQFRLGDTLTEGEPLQFEGQWQFSPECFGTLRCADTGRRKQFDKGLAQLVEEGAIQLLREPVSMSPEPVLAAVGQLQFEVVQYRLESEYNAKTTLHRLPFRIARWVTGDPADVAELRVPSLGRQLQDQDGIPVVLFESEGMLRYCRELNPNLTFSEVSPTATRNF